MNSRQASSRDANRSATISRMNLLGLPQGRFGRIDGDQVLSHVIFEAARSACHRWVLQTRY